MFRAGSVSQYENKVHLRVGAKVDPEVGVLSPEILEDPNLTHRIQGHIFLT